MGRRRIDHDQTAQRLSEAQISLHTATRGHDEALADRINHVLAETLSELLLRLSNLELDLQMINKKLDILVERDQANQREVSSS